jgi:hypothetical protein
MGTLVLVGRLQTARPGTAAVGSLIDYRCYRPASHASTTPGERAVERPHFVAFTGAFAPGVDTALLPAVAGLGAFLAGLLGAFLSWFNATIVFPRPVSTQSKAERQPSGA